MVIGVHACLGDVGIGPDVIIGIKPFIGNAGKGADIGVFLGFAVIGVIVLIDGQGPIRVEGGDQPADGVIMESGGTGAGG